MKIYEIIAEQQTTESVGSWLAGKALPQIAKYAEPAVVKALKTGSKSAGKLAKSAPVAAKGTSKLASLSADILSILKMLGIGKIIYNYIDDVSKGEAKLASGEWTQEEFDDFRQGMMTQLIAELAASTVLFSAIKLLSGFSIFVRLLGFSRFTAPIGALLNGLSETARIAFIGYIATSKDARSVIADCIATMVQSQLGATVDNAVGGTGVYLLDKVKHLIGLSQKDPKFFKDAEKDSAGDEPGTDNTSTQAGKPSNNAQSNKSSDYTLQPGTERDPRTGAIRPKFDPI